MSDTREQLDAVATHVCGWEHSVFPADRGYVAHGVQGVIRRFSPRTNNDHAMMVLDALMRQDEPHLFLPEWKCGWDDGASDMLAIWHKGSGDASQALRDCITDAAIHLTEKPS